MTWPGGFTAGYLSGYVEGLSRGREQAETEMANLWRAAFEAVQRHAGGTPYAERQERLRARQIASCERQKREAVPWPEETPS